MRADWSDYRYFIAVARAGSLSAGARLLDVDQSTVGRRLAALEQQVGARLFDRTPDGYVLTAAGESVRADVEELERGFLAVERRLAGGDARLAGVVRVAVTATFASMFLIPELGRLRARHPELVVELLVGNQPVDLARREADLAVRVGAPPRQPNLVVRHVGSVGFALLAAAGYLARRGSPRVRDGLRGHDIVGYAGELADSPLARALAAQAPHGHVVCRASTIEAVRDAVAASLGISVLPGFFAEGAVRRVGRTKLGTSAIWSVVHEDLLRNARVRAVQRFVTEILAATAPPA